MDQPLRSTGQHENRPARPDQFDACEGVETDEGLRSALGRLVDQEEFRGGKDWEAIGAQVLSLAERQARHWHRHAAEYASAFTVAVVELLRSRPEVVLNAGSPWGLAMASGRYAAERAVAEQATGGLTGRDRVSHRLRVSAAPLLVSLEALSEAADDGHIE